MAENGEPSHVDVDAFRHVNIGIPEHRQYGYHRPPIAHGGVAQIEVEISEGTSGQGPPAQPEFPAPHGVTQQRSGETGGHAAGTRGPKHCLRQVLLQVRQFPGALGLQRRVDPRTELLERQPARDQMFPKGE
jgi:hypothetical protein